MQDEDTATVFEFEAPIEDTLSVAVKEGCEAVLKTRQRFRPIIQVPSTLTPEQVAALAPANNARFGALVQSGRVEDSEEYDHPLVFARPCLVASECTEPHTDPMVVGYHPKSMVWFLSCPHHVVAAHSLSEVFRAMKLRHCEKSANAS